MSDASWPTVTQASKQIGVSGAYLRQMLYKGRLVGRQKGTTWVIDPQSLAQLQRHREERKRKKKSNATG